jgi:hypothetical protein
MHRDFSYDSYYLDLSQNAILCSWWAVFNFWGCIKRCTFHEIYWYLANCEELTLLIGSFVRISWSRRVMMLEL